MFIGLECFSNALPILSRALIGPTPLPMHEDCDLISYTQARVPLSLFVVWCSVFPLVVDRPEMPCIMAGMYQMDSSLLVVVYGSGVCNAGFGWLRYTSRYVSFWRRQALDALQIRTRRTDCSCVVVDSWQWHVQSWFYCYSAPRAVFLVLLSSGPDARHLGRYGPA